MNARHLRHVPSFRHCPLDADVIAAADPSALRVRIRPTFAIGAPDCYATFDVDRPSAAAIDLAQNICDRLNAPISRAAPAIGGPAPRPGWLHAMVGIGYVLAGGGLLLIGMAAVGALPIALVCAQ